MKNNISIENTPKREENVASSYNFVLYCNQGSEGINA